GTYGYGRDTSPALDALAAEGVRFERAFAHVPITLPSHTTMLTGTLPTAHGVRDNGRFVAADALVTLPEILAGRGYATGAFVSAFVLDSRFGLDQGFDVYDDSFTAEWSEDKLRDARIYNQMVTDRPADQTTERAMAWLRDHAGRPFFLWVHYYDPHQRYAPPHPWDQLYQDSPYDGEIAFMDSQIARLFGELRELGGWDGTAVVVTGDHGEGLGQHGEATHAVLAYDATLRVPLIVKPPAAFTAGTRLAGTRAAGGRAPGGRVVTESVSHVDLLPTIADLLGFPPPSGLPGRSLAAALRGEAAAAPAAAYFESALPRFSFGWEPLFGVRAAGWKYIHAPRPELYDLARDPDELHDLAAAEGERREALEALLFRVIADNPPLTAAGGGGTMNDEVRRRLAALGYVGGAGGGAAEAELNPRQPSGRRSPLSGITFLADYYLANALAGWGRLQEAARIFATTLLPLDPENPTFLSTLANLERRLGRSDEAFALYRRAQAIDPEDPAILVALGQLERDRGRPEAARGLLEAARELAPDDLTAVVMLADLAAAAGRTAEAIELYRAALAIDGSHVDSLLGLGVELARSGQAEEARGELKAATAAAPFSPRAHYNLGLLELRAGRAEEAAAAFGRALRYERPYPAASLGLASARIELGDLDAAREELERLVAEARQPEAVEQARRLLANLDSASDPPAVPSRGGEEEP
ncbi:MAG: sulfatase-like hydrolase/transferase, partial [Acidobacteriota bacterium]|nr:sulfatase-like hydrolase/transferase [Acidobacteriota bacterium]